MNNHLYGFFVAVAALLLTAGSPPQTVPTIITPDSAGELPVDSAILRGRLPNGLTYYVRENSRPDNRAELRLVVGVGSVQEASDQRGLAHFVEHMAFNGTRRFPKQELVAFLESIGIRFGSDLNAFTSMDETVYSLQVPTDSVHQLDRGLDVLEDWARGISFDSAEIEKERGVVVEEWRLRRGAESRMRDKHFPVVLRGSRYADRLPIGVREILDTFHHDRLREFYRMWYRPEFMAVIAVGDFKAEEMLAKIRERFGRIPAAPRHAELPVHPVPEHEETLYSVATDPEATRASVSVNWKHKVRTVENETDYRRALVESFFHSMLGQRFYEVSRLADPPFQYAYSYSPRYTATLEATILMVQLDENKIVTGLTRAMSEIERVRKHGFLASELERQKTEMIRGYRQAYAERDKTESGAFAREYANHFLEGGPLLGMETEVQLAERIIPSISLDEVNSVADRLMPDRNRVVTINAPEREGLAIPGPEELAAVLASARTMGLEPYTESVSQRPLIDPLPAPGKIVAERWHDSVDVMEWQLSNGVRVLVKQTDFKNDEVLLAAFSPGGSSLASDQDYLHAASAVAAATEGGLGDFGRIELEKALAGKIAGVYPYISELHEGLSGSASPDDLETLFQLTWLNVTSPRFDSAAFESYRTKGKVGVRNRNARPESARWDTIQALLSGYHPRRRPWVEETYDLMDPGRALRFYRDRFSDVGDFTFLIVGNVDTARARVLVETYLASLPSNGRTESWRDIGARAPDSLIERTLYRGSEPKASVDLVFTGPFEFGSETRNELYAMTSVLEIMMREALREEQGGTYDVGVYASPSHYPQERYTMTVSFGCDPARVDGLTRAAFVVIDSLKEHGPSAENLGRIRETARREHETYLRENRYWLGSLQQSLMHNEPLTRILTGTREFEQVSAERIRDAARRYLDPRRLVKVVLLPEGKK